MTDLITPLIANAIPGVRSAPTTAQVDKTTKTTPVVIVYVIVPIVATTLIIASAVLFWYLRQQA